MSIFTFGELQSEASQKFGSQVITKSFTINSSRTAASQSFGAVRNDPDSTPYDIFLSHSIQDRVAITGLKVVLEKLGFKTYVDWICDPLLDRSKVSKATSEKLCQRMNNSKSLVYAFSTKAASSVWMPWELGYVHGRIDRCAVLRIEEEAGSFSYTGFEYLELYPYVDKTGNTLWVQRTIGLYAKYSDWIKNGKIP